MAIWLRQAALCTEKEKPPEVWGPLRWNRIQSQRVILFAAL